MSDQKLIAEARALERKMLDSRVGPGDRIWMQREMIARLADRLESLVVGESSGTGDWEWAFQWPNGVTQPISEEAAHSAVYGEAPHATRVVVRRRPPSAPGPWIPVVPLGDLGGEQK